MKLFIIIFLSLLSFNITGQSIEVISYHQLEEYYNSSNDTLYVINYWATWCQSCVEELAGFIKLQDEMRNEKFKMILVSLDSPEQSNLLLHPFLKENNINGKIVLLDDDPNVWINRVNTAWEGAIPATQVIKNKSKGFYNKSLSYEQLHEIVSTFNSKQRL